jgi:hypothetical protein
MQDWERGMLPLMERNEAAEIGAPNFDLETKALVHLFGRRKLSKLATTMTSPF